MVSNIVGLVPAAGMGKRLYPFSRAVPKELYPILGKPVIEHVVENLKMGNVQKIFMVVGHKKSAIMDYIGDGRHYDVDVAYIFQLEQLGLGHAILQGEKWINSTFVTLLGDSFLEPKHEINQMIKLHRRERPVATLMLFEVPDPTGYGIVKLDLKDKNSGVITKMIEKPSEKEAEEYISSDGNYYAICGLYTFEPLIFDYIKKAPLHKNSGEIHITNAIQTAIENDEKVMGMVLSGEYIDIGKWNTALRAEKKFLEGKDIDHHIEERENVRMRMTDD
jgi:dTDP-glucose pyrophosphorylase